MHTHGIAAMIGKALILTGILLVLAGLAMLVLPKMPWIGRLPGDINLQGRNFSLHFPIVTCLIISILLTIILNLFFRK
jgi:hypothetical protein